MLLNGHIPEEFPSLCQ
uniref:Uncharacterized protein n=1 Tax=Anguilla anguilla TaxID=7936 RepID=A0A0E9S8X3_ANGAN